MMTMCVVVVALCNIIKLSDDLESEKDIVTTFVFLCVPDLRIRATDSCWVTRCPFCWVVNKKKFTNTKQMYFKQFNTKYVAHNI